MPTYAIGDIQGCYQTLVKLLNKVEFNPKKDQLWLCGDLVNRGPDSLETLTFLYGIRESVRCVLGNHDLHFLAVESGAHLPRPKDTFNEIFQSSKREKLVKWLRQQPLFIRDKSLNFAMGHAGLPPHWSVKQAERYAAEVSTFIRSKSALEFYFAMYGNKPNRWREKLSGLDRLRYITNALTRMRYCYPDGRLELTSKNSPGKQSKGLLPWFEIERRPSKYNIIFGHWASLQGKCDKPGLFALDTGCVWGGRLTALRLEDKKRFSVKSQETITG